VGFAGSVDGVRGLRPIVRLSACVSVIGAIDHTVSVEDGSPRRVTASFVTLALPPLTRKGLH